MEQVHMQIACLGSEVEEEQEQQQQQLVVL